MPEQENDNEKTEEPTHRRLQEAVKKGQVAFSREVSSFFIFVVLALNIIWFAPNYMPQTLLIFSKFLVEPHDIFVDEGNISALITDVVIGFAMVMVLPIIASVIAALLSSFLQNGIVISTEPLMPKLERISLFKGIKRLFSLRSVLEFVKGLIKISLVGATAYIVVVGEFDRMEDVISYDVADVTQTLGLLMFKMVIGACAVMLVIALLDYLYQKFEYIKSLKMTRQELKEEFKQTDGDPQIKAKLREIRMERARKRMMAAVPQSDVIIRNPTHYAVALKYDEAVMRAPVVVAMGQDRVAERIIELAEEHRIPTVSNPPLAQALYKSASLDEEIPLEHYRAVAEVIGYVYKLKGRNKKAA